MKKKCVTIKDGRVISPNRIALGGIMKTDMEVKPEVKTPAYKEVFFKLSNCGRFGAIVSGKDVLQWIASRQKGIAFVREASVYESIISYEARDKLAHLINQAPSLAMREDQVEFSVRESVQELNKTLESYQKVRHQMFTLSERVDASLTEQILAERRYN